MTPNDIAKASACFNCSDRGGLLRQMLSLLSLIASQIPSGSGFLLQENGFSILQENGSHILV